MDGGKIVNEQEREREAFLRGIENRGKNALFLECERRLERKRLGSGKAGKKKRWWRRRDCCISPSRRRRRAGSIGFTL